MARFSDHLTLEGARTHNFKDYDLFYGCFEKYGPFAFRWAMGRPSSIKIVRLAAIWIFFRGGHEKLQKTAFFAKIPSPQHFCEGKFFRIEPCESSRLDSENLLIFGRGSFLTGVIAVKVGRLWNFKFFPKNIIITLKVVLKKDTATILSFWIRHECRNLFTCLA